MQDNAQITVEIVSIIHCIAWIRGGGEFKLV